jgi:hypothetical protein
MHEMQASKTAAEFIKTLDYPIAKSDVLRAAAEAQLPDDIVQRLRRLADRDYRDADDLTAGLNALD